MRNVRNLFCWLSVVLFASVSAVAQSGPTGALAGTVTDPSGRAVPGAEVSVRGEWYAAATESSTIARRPPL